MVPDSHPLAFSMCFVLFCFVEAAFTGLFIVNAFALLEHFSLKFITNITQNSSSKEKNSQYKFPYIAESVESKTV